MKPTRTKRQQLEAIKAQMANERSSFEPLWRDCGEYVLPKRPRFFTEDSNKGDRRDSRIVDGTATYASRTLRSGMMSGITSPARPWFKLTTSDPDLAKFWRVKEWLEDVSLRMRDMFLKSNFYNSLPITYGDLGTFGTHSLFFEEDFETVLRTFPMAIGSYYLSNNSQLKVDCLHRDFRMTTRQLVEKFGKNALTGKPDWKVFSTAVKDAWDRGDYETWFNVCHIIKPNEDWDPKKLDSKYKRYISIYYEAGHKGNDSGRRYLNADDEDRYLSEKGYDYFPAPSPRWEINGEDVYATSWPAQDAIGDIKQLQLGERNLMMAIDKIVNPPMKAPTSLRTQSASALPGDITFLDVREGMQGLSPLYEVNPRILELENKQAQVRGRIQKGFYEDLFLMLGSLDKRGMTATEVAERHEEKLLALGPVLEQLNSDFFDPIVDIGYGFMTNQGLVPPAPEELQGVSLKIEYTSIMAQAQKLAGLVGIDRYIRFVGEVAQFKPEVLDKVDPDKMADYYAEVTGIPVSINRSDEDVAMIRQQRAEAQQAAQQAETMKQMASSAKDLSQTDMAGDNALMRLVGGGAAA